MKEMAFKQCKKCFRTDISFFELYNLNVGSVKEDQTRRSQVPVYPGKCPLCPCHRFIGVFGVHWSPSVYLVTTSALVTSPHSDFVPKCQQNVPLS